MSNANDLPYFGKQLDRCGYAVAFFLGVAFCGGLILAVEWWANR